MNEFAAMQRTQYENSNEPPPAGVTTINMAAVNEEIVSLATFRTTTQALSGGSESSHIHDLRLFEAGNWPHRKFLFKGAA